MIKKGNSNNASQVLIGDREVFKVYIGSNLVWENSPKPLIFFDTGENETIPDCRFTCGGGSSGYVEAVNNDTGLYNDYNYCIKLPGYTIDQTTEIIPNDITLIERTGNSGSSKAYQMIKRILLTDEVVHLPLCRNIQPFLQYNIYNTSINSALEEVHIRLKTTSFATFGMTRSSYIKYPNISKITLGFSTSHSGSVNLGSGYFSGLITLEFYGYNESLKEWSLGGDFSNLSGDIYLLNSCPALVNLLGITKLKRDMGLSKCPNLSQDSLNGIFEALEDLNVEGKTATLSLSISHQSKISDTQIAEATQKGWNVTFG